MSKPHTPIFNRLGILYNWKTIHPLVKGKESIYLQNITKIKKILDRYRHFIIDESLVFKDENNVIIELKTYTQILNSKISAIKAGLEKYEIISIINVVKISNSYWYGSFVANMIAQKIQKGFNYKKVIANIIAKLESVGLLGAKIRISGRLNGAELHTSELFGFGVCSLNTLNYEIDYSMQHIKMSYGTLGLKVWINRKYIDVSNISLLI